METSSIDKKRRPICRYGSECRRIDKGCKFHHPPFQSSNNNASNNSNNNSNNNNGRTKKDSTTPCRYGMKCRDSSCTYFHHPNHNNNAHSKAAVNNNDNNAVNSLNSTNGGNNGNSVKKKKNCRWGDSCRNKKCTFVHPPPPSNYNSNNNDDDDDGSNNNASTGTMIGNDERKKAALLFNTIHNHHPTHDDNDDDNPSTNAATTSSNNHYNKEQYPYSPSSKLLSTHDNYSPLLFANGITAAADEDVAASSSAGDEKNYDAYNLPEGCDWMYEVLGLDRPDRLTADNNNNNNNNNGGNSSGNNASRDAVASGHNTAKNSNDATMITGNYNYNNATDGQKSIHDNVGGYNNSSATVSSGGSYGANALSNHHGSSLRGGYDATTATATITATATTATTNAVSPRNHAMPHGNYNTAPRSYNSPDKNGHHHPHTRVARVDNSNNAQPYPGENTNNAGSDTNVASLNNNANHNDMRPPRSNGIAASGKNGNARLSSSSSFRLFSNDTEADRRYLTNNNNNSNRHDNHKDSTAPSAKEVSEPSNHKVYLLSTDTMDHYRNTAIQLLQVSYSANNAGGTDTNRFAIVQQCRTNQKRIQSLLQNHMNSIGSVETIIDEGNLSALLDLNELLLNAIDEAVAVATESNSNDPALYNGLVDKEESKNSDKKVLNGNGKKQNEQPQQQQQHSVVEGGAKQVKKKKGKTENSNGITATSTAATSGTTVSSSNGATATKTFQSKNGVGAAGEVQLSNVKHNNDGTKKIIDAKSNDASSTTQSSIGKNNAAGRKVESSDGKSNASTKNISIKDETDPQPLANNDDTPHSDSPEISEIDPLEAARLEKERIALLMQKAREEAALAKEKKKSKKSKKHEKWLRDQETAKEQRASHWKEKIEKWMDYLSLIRKLLIAEFLRQNKKKAILTSDLITSNADACDVIEVECREAYHTIFRELKVRIVVAGSQHKELKGRNGTIRYWDEEKGKFCVGLDTKKSMDSNEMFLSPDVLDELAVSSSQSKKSDKRNLMTSSYDVNVSNLMTYGDVILGLQFTLKKSHINSLGSAVSTKIGLEAFCRQRDEEERQKKLEEERERAREEEDRKRRAARKAAENMAWERRKEQMRKDKEEYERMKKEWKKWQDNDDYDNDEAECNCPRCRFGDKFYPRGSSGAFFFNIGGIPFRVNFGSDSEEEDFFDEFDEEWEEQMLEEKREENRKQATILGVEPDADERTLKISYRKLALQFHPDKWKSTSDHGMSRKDAENKFKAIQSAYDHLMSNFD